MRRRSLLALPGLLLTGCARSGPEPGAAPAASTAAAPIHVPRPEASPAPAPPSGLDRAAYAELTWTMLRGLDPRSGEASPLLEAIEGTPIRIAGYMVPFDDGFREVTEFLLVPTAGACVHTPPPPPNQIVYATLPAGRPAKTEPGEAVWVYGQLEIAAADSPYGEAGFKLAATAVERRG